MLGFEKKFNKELIEKNSSVLVAVSGGADSVALMHYLNSIKQEYNIKITCVNIDHNIRVDSKSDSDFVSAICEKCDIECIRFSGDIISLAKESKKSLEQCARDFRIDCFRRAIKSTFASGVYLAHHLDDNIESVLLNIFRGCAVRGLIGMRDENDGFIRPMLKISKDEIYEYVKFYNLEYVTDYTNFESVQTRNYLRNEITPKVKERFEGYKEAITSLSMLAKEDEEYFSKIVNDLVFCENGHSYVNVETLTSNAVSYRAYLLALAKIGLNNDVFNANLQEVDKLRANKSGSVASLPKGYIAIREYDKIVFMKSLEKVNLSFKIEEGRIFAFDKQIALSLENKFNFSSNYMLLDFDKLPKNAIIRTRCDGDVFVRSCGRQNLNNYFVDKKVPKRLRDNILVIACGSEVLCVLFYEVGSPLFIDDKTKLALKIQIIQHNAEEK